MGPQLRLGVIGVAWRLYRRRWWSWSLAMLIVMIANSIIGSALFAAFGAPWHGGRGGFRLPMVPDRSAMAYVGTVVVACLCLGGMIRMASRQVLTGDVRIEDLFSVVDVGFHLLAGAVFYAAATFLGAMLCIVPGAIVSGLLMFTLPLIVIARRPATEAVAESWRALAPQWLAATVFHLVLGAVSGLGSLLCCVGILITGPLYSLSIALLFHQFYEPTRPTFAAKPPPVDSYPGF